VVHCLSSETLYRSNVNSYSRELFDAETPHDVNGGLMPARIQKSCIPSPAANCCS
jgi:hypothetical protein